jgi:hypothetical protein
LVRRGGAILCQKHPLRHPNPLQSNTNSSLSAAFIAVAPLHFSECCGNILTSADSSTKMKASIQTVFAPAKEYGGPGRFGFAPETHLTEESALITTQNRMKLFAEWCRYWDLAKPYLLEKSRPNLIRTRFLQALFPQSSFIVISRHPIAVSLSTSKWTDCSMDSLMEHWLHCHRLFEQDRPHLRRVMERRVMEIRYEDLIRDSHSTLQQVCKFLGLAPHSPEPLNSKFQRERSLLQSLVRVEDGQADVHYIAEL